MKKLAAGLLHCSIIFSIHSTAQVTTFNNNVGIRIPVNDNPNVQLDLFDIKFGRITDMPAQPTEGQWGAFMVGSIHTSPYQELRLGVSNDLAVKSEIRFVNHNDPNNGYMEFRTTNFGSSQRRMLIAPNGNVCVGPCTTMPAYQLYVNGEGYFSRVSAGPLQWPDYVFDQSYRLRPLKELEAYIARNRHLPNIPSASEVADKGIDLGESQAKLLEKIEELTLYLLQQNKTIEEQSKQLAELKETVSSLMGNRCTKKN